MIVLLITYALVEGDLKQVNQTISNNLVFHKVLQHASQLFHQATISNHANLYKRRLEWVCHNLAISILSYCQIYRGQFVLEIQKHWNPPKICWARFGAPSFLSQFRQSILSQTQGVQSRHSIEFLQLIFLQSFYLCSILSRSSQQYQVVILNQHSFG